MPARVLHHLCRFMQVYRQQNLSVCTRTGSAAQQLRTSTHPESRWGGVGVEHGVGDPSQHTEVALQSTPRLNTILKEEGVPHDVIGDVVLHRGVGKIQRFVVNTCSMHHVW